MKLLLCSVSLFLIQITQHRRNGEVVLCHRTGFHIMILYTSQNLFVEELAEHVLKYLLDFVFVNSRIQFSLSANICTRNNNM